MKKKMDVQFEWNIRISDEGYRHVPILYLAYGKDGFIASIPFVNILVRWGNALNDKVAKCKE